MPWTPYIEAKFIGQVIENVKTIIERDQVAALTWANGGTVLPSFDEVHRARRLDIRYPFVAVFAATTAMQSLEEGRAVNETHLVIIETAHVDTDPDVLALTLHKYVRALDSIIRKASDADMAAGLSGETTPIWDITDHEYDPIREPRQEDKQGKYLLAARLVLSERVTET